MFPLKASRILFYNTLSIAPSRLKLFVANKQEPVKKIKNTVNKNHKVGNKICTNPTWMVIESLNKKIVIGCQLQQAFIYQQKQPVTANRSTLLMYVEELFEAEKSKDTVFKLRFVL